MILHLVAEGEWLLQPDRPYAAPSLATEGFVHCSPDDRVLLAVANLLYRTEPGPFIVVELDEAELTSEVRWEPAAGPAPAEGAAVLFPHVYGPLDRAAAVGLRQAERAPDGTFLAFVTATDRGQASRRVSTIAPATRDTRA
jgi:uncharacterized protein (DUF952 family)